MPGTAGGSEFLPQRQNWVVGGSKPLPLQVAMSSALQSCPPHVFKAAFSLQAAGPLSHSVA
jgi:hypothetical protein